jgi:hypothetical protein
MIHTKFKELSQKYESQYTQTAKKNCTNQKKTVPTKKKNRTKTEPIRTNLSCTTVKLVVREKKNRTNSVPIRTNSVPMDSTLAGSSFLTLWHAAPDKTTPVINRP